MLIRIRLITFLHFGIIHGIFYYWLSIYPFLLLKTTVYYEALKMPNEWEYLASGNLYLLWLNCTWAFKRSQRMNCTGKQLELGEKLFLISQKNYINNWTFYFFLFFLFLFPFDLLEGAMVLWSPRFNFPIYIPDGYYWFQVTAF